MHASTATSELRIEPPREILEAARAWLAPVRSALGGEFLVAYLTGSVLTQGFDPRRSRINVVVIARSLGSETLERLREAMPVTRKAPHFDPLFLAQGQIQPSLDSFPIEWLEMKERHLVLEGDDVLAETEVPQTYLRLQCEHELRAKLIQLRQAYLASAKRPRALEDVLRGAASSFATLFRTLLRLRGETPPASAVHSIERVAVLFHLDAQALLGAHFVRQSSRRYSATEIVAIYRKFLGEIDRLAIAIDQLPIR